MSEIARRRLRFMWELKKAENLSSLIEKSPTLTLNHFTAYFLNLKFVVLWLPYHGNTGRRCVCVFCAFKKTRCTPCRFHRRIISVMRWWDYYRSSWSRSYIYFILTESSRALQGAKHEHHTLYSFTRVLTLRVRVPAVHLLEASWQN